jgi:hypothetical protein
MMIQTMVTTIAITSETIIFCQINKSIMVQFSDIGPSLVGENVFTTIIINGINTSTKLNNINGTINNQRLLCVEVLPLKNRFLFNLDSKLIGIMFHAV